MLLIANNVAYVARSNGRTRDILFQSSKLFDWQLHGSILVVSFFVLFYSTSGSAHEPTIQYIHSPANETDFKAYRAAVSTYAQSCIDLSTPKGITAHIGTADTVQDWNSLREALGYKRLHFLSVS